VDENVSRDMEEIHGKLTNKENKWNHEVSSGERVTCRLYYDTEALTSDLVHAFLITRHCRRRHFLRNLFGPPYLFISCNAAHVHIYN